MRFVTGARRAALAAKVLLGTLLARIAMHEDGGAGWPATMVVTVGGRSIRYQAVAGEPDCP